MPHINNRCDTETTLATISGYSIYESSELKNPETRWGIDVGYITKTDYSTNYYYYIQVPVIS